MVERWCRRGSRWGLNYYCCKNKVVLLLSVVQQYKSTCMEKGNIWMTTVSKIQIHRYILLHRTCQQVLHEVENISVCSRSPVQAIQKTQSQILRGNPKSVQLYFASTIWARLQVLGALSCEKNHTMRTGALPLRSLFFPTVAAVPASPAGELFCVLICATRI